MFFDATVLVLLKDLLGKFKTKVKIHPTPGLCWSWQELFHYCNEIVLST